MQPNQDQYPIDYLNQIAPKPEPKPLKPWMMVAAIVGGLLIMGLIALIAFSGSKGPDMKTSLAALDARISTLTRLSRTYHDKLRSDNIRTANVNMTGYLSGLTSELKEPTEILTEGKKANTGPIIAGEKEMETKFKEKIDTALLNGNADRTYALEMTYELEKLQTGIKNTAKKANSKSFDKFAENSESNINDAIKQLEDFEASF